MSRMSKKLSQAPPNSSAPLIVTVNLYDCSGSSKMVFPENKVYPDNKVTLSFALVADQKEVPPLAFACELI